MSLTVEINGIVYKNFVTARVTRSMRTLLGDFEFIATANTANVLPLKVGDQVKILADGATVMTGYADPLEIEYSVGSHSFSVSGRDIAQDLVDSTLKGAKNFSGGTLTNLIEKVIANLGIPIKVINNVTGLEPFESISSATVDQRAFEFLESYSRKRQVLLTTDSDSNIVITRTATELSGIYLNHVKFDAERLNNILSARISFNNTNRFNTYQARGNDNPSLGDSFSITSTPEEIVSIKSSAVDSKIRSTRFFEFTAEESMRASDLGKRAQWEANIRRANSFSYTCVIQGYSDSFGNVWKPNTLVVVDDQFMGVQSKLLISDVVFMYDRRNGSTTELTLTLPDAFSVQAELDAVTENTQEIGLNLL
jgi:prophage tail gpP-like protein